ncbi:T9SS type A sorting domain-containing protein [Polaribacter sp. IC066]|nr:T9SS type A sorting domain-containing protein [Polaribacter sp. IC063]TXD62341.1 T9SS type A sorting domain-containing protein [Polaribacter sp. IC066]
MQNNYSRKFKSILLFMSLLVGLTSYAQDIHFTFANAQNTNSDGNAYYEVDVMMQTINTTGSFKLGSGQLYFTYNTAAFGTNVNASSSFEVTQEDGYTCGQGIDLAASINIYGGFTTNDNTTSRVSWAFSQTFSSSTFAADNINEDATKLCRIKIKYTDASEDATFMFESGANYTDQFFTACGLADGGSTATANCTTEPGIQLVNDSFDSVGATLSNTDFEFVTSLSLFPNPATTFFKVRSENEVLEQISLYDVNGKKVFEKSSNQKEITIDIQKLKAGIYFAKIISNKGSQVKKIIKK